MKIEPKVSIIVPVYNVEQYLKVCIESILVQTYTNIELILVDDGSSDKSSQICDEYSEKDNRIMVIHQKNLGVSTARNNGIKNATGEFICFIDADDFVKNSYLETLIKKSDVNNLCVCKIKRFIDDINCSNELKKEILTNKLNKENFIELYKIGLLNTPCCKLYNRNIIISNNIVFNKNICIGEDLLFNIEYLKYIDTIIIIDSVQYFYRKSESDTLSNKYIASFKDAHIIIYDAFENFFMGHVEQKELFKYLCGFLFVIFEHEFVNKSVGMLLRIKNAKKILKEKEIRKRIIECNKVLKNKYTFILKYRLVIIYKTLKKIGILKSIS